MLFLIVFAPFAANVNGSQLPSIEDLIASDGEVEVDSQARGFFEKAIARYRANDMDGAIHYGTLAYRKDQKILLLEDKGLIDGIESYLKEETYKSPEDASLFYGLAKILALRNKIDEAKEALEKIVSIDADSDLGKRAATVLRGAPGNVSSSQDSGKNAMDRSSYDEEYARLEAENSKLQSKNRIINREIGEEKNIIEKQAALNREKDRQIAELTERNRMDSLYSTLFWANPTNSWAMNNNYTKPTAGQIKQYPDYYKAKAAEHKARVEYRKGYAPARSPGRPVNLPAIRR